MKIYLVFIFTMFLSAVKAQVEDHFDDGDFTNSPSWSGSVTDFNVNPAGQLQLNAAAAGNSYLSVPANLNAIDSCEWTFHINLDFSPSTSNYARVYLSSDQPDLTQPLNGYFLLFGESLSNDAVELFRQDGTSVTSICRGADAMIANAFSAGVKVTRNNSGVWTLSVDYSGGINYMIESSGTDATYNFASFIGVFCEYTSGNISKFFFDDFYAGHIIPDTVLPFVENLIVVSDTMLLVVFSEIIENSSLNDLNNYFVDNAIGNPVSIYADSTNPLKYFLRFNSAFQTGINYSISFSGLIDLAQNEMLNVSKTFSYSPVIPAQMHDIVLTEIYFEPSSLSPLPYGEYVELFNTRDSSIDISGWTVTDGSSDGVIPSFHFVPGGYVLLYDVDDSLDFISIPNAVAVHDLPTLNNDVGDNLRLLNSSGDLIDEIKFSDNFYHDGDKNDGGWSIERIDPQFTCANDDNWKASTANSHGTPGEVNSVNGVFMDAVSPFAVSAFPDDSLSITVVFSEGVSSASTDLNNYHITGSGGNVIALSSVTSSDENDSVFLKTVLPMDAEIYSLQISETLTDCPGNTFNSDHSLNFGFPEDVSAGDVLINELLFDPKSGGNDFLELYNCSAKIIDLSHWKISEADFNDADDIKEEALITTGHKLFFPGEYLALTENESGVKPFFTCENDFAFMNVDGMPDFNSDEGRAIVYDNEGNIIDAFRYSDDMHFPLLIVTDGVSLERLSTDIKNDDSLNWHSAAATAGFATPGYGNSQRLGHVSGDGEITLETEIFSPDNDGIDDVLAIHYDFPQNGTVLSLNVFDYNGQPVRTIVDGETVSNEGALTWDGLTDKHLVAASGIYILLARSFDVEGNEKAIKKTCFLTRKQ